MNKNCIKSVVIDSEQAVAIKENVVKIREAVKYMELFDIESVVLLDVVLDKMEVEATFQILKKGLKDELQRIL